MYIHRYLYLYIIYMGGTWRPQCVAARWLASHVSEASGPTALPPPCTPKWVQIEAWRCAYILILATRIPVCGPRKPLKTGFGLMPFE